MSESKKEGSRWRKGGQRYTARESQALNKLREQPGWRNGARVYKRQS